MSPYWVLAAVAVVVGQSVPAIAWYAFNAYMARKFGLEALDKTRHLRAPTVREALPFPRRQPQAEVEPAQPQEPESRT